MKKRLLVASLLACIYPALAQSVFSDLHPPRLAGYYDGNLDGRLPIHAYFFPTTKGLDGVLEGYYRYGQRKQTLHLAGAYFSPDSLLVEEFTAPSQHVDEHTGLFRLQFRADGSLRGTWRAQRGGPRLPVELHPVAGPGPTNCPPVRLVQRRGQPLTLGTADKQAVTIFAAWLAGEEALNEADPGTQLTTVTYTGHNLVSLELTSEMRGASVTIGYRFATFDACTGSKLTASEQLDPHRLEAFKADADVFLHQQLEDYIAERGPQGQDPLLSEEDVAGLRSQHFELDPEQLQLTDGQVSFPHYVSYGMMSNFISKAYAGRFGAVFSFEDIQTYLRPTSPLRRLVLPTPARAAPATGKPPRKPITRKSHE